MRVDKPTGAYSPVSIINEGNQVIADKLQFFSDCLRLMSLKSGEYYHYEVENHLSLLDNLIFYADGEINSITPNESRTIFTIQQIQYITGTHPLLKSDDGLIIKDKSRSTRINSIIQSIVQTVPRGPRSQRQALEKARLVTIRAELSDIKNLMSPTYVDDVVTILYSMVQCNHKLNYHKSGLEYLSRLVFAHFYIDGYSRQAIIGFIGSLLGRKVDRYEDRIYLDTFLPEGLYSRLRTHNLEEHPFNQQLFNEIQEFLENRTLKQQIDGFIYKAKYQQISHNFIFRVDGIMLNQDETELLGLKLMRIDAFKKKHSEDSLKDIEDFLTYGHHSMLVELNVFAYSQDEATHKALTILKKKMGKAVRRIRGKFAINQTGYTFYPIEHGRFHVNTMPESTRLYKSSIDSIEHREKLIGSSAFKELYEQLERILVEGYIEEDINISLHHYRKFMQSLHDNIASQNIESRDGIPKEIRVMACLLTNCEKKNFVWDINGWASNIIYNFSPLRQNQISDNLRIKISKGGYVPFNELIKESDQEHAKYEARKARYFSKRIDKKKVYQYYVRQLLYMKNYRDKYEHANSHHDEIARKLNLYTYKLMTRMMEGILSELEKNSNKGLSHQVILGNWLDSGYEA